MILRSIFEPRKLVEIIALTACYIISARLGQVFAIAPGNVTPVWFPCGIIFAWVFLRGYYVWPGIFLGAYLGNTWAYSDYSAIEPALATLVAGGLNSIGEVACALGAVYFYRRHADYLNPVSQLRPFLIFIFVAAFLGPLASALLSVSGLVLSGILLLQDVQITFITKMVGDMIGVLLISTLIFINFDEVPDVRKNKSTYERLLYILSVFLLSVVYIGLPEIQPFGTQVEYFILPLLLWATIRFNLRVAFISAFYFSFILIISQSGGYTAFPSEQELSSLLALQFFIIMTICSIFIISFMVMEREKALAQVSEMNQHDQLTGTYDKRYFNKVLRSEIKRQLRSNEQFSLLLLQADQLEDSQNLSRKDERILIDMSRLARSQILDFDTLARWNERQFIILLPGIGTHKAETVADNIRSSIKESLVSEQAVSVSISVIEFLPESEIEGVLKQLGELLETARASGGNRVQVADSA